MTPSEAAAAAREVARLQMHRFGLDLGALLVPGSDLDPWTAALLIGRTLADAPPDQVQTMRQWPLNRWLEEIRDASPTVEPGAPRAPTLPPPPPTAPPPPPAGGTAMIPAPPQGLPPELHEAWIQARTRAGEFARGLGNTVERETGEVVAEVWSGEDLLEEVDGEARARALRIIREETSDAIAQGQTAQKLASRLGNATGRWGRDWERVARTETRGAVSEGAAIHAVRTWGDEARVARVPESDACEQCRRHYLENGRPRIFTVAELVENGTNAGKKQADWSATLFPLHPNCMCDTQQVPPGFEFDASWDLVPSKGAP